MGPNQQNPYPGNILRPTVVTPGLPVAGQPPPQPGMAVSGPANLFNPAYAPAPPGATPPLASFAPASNGLPIAASPAPANLAAPQLAMTPVTNNGILPPLSAFGGGSPQPSMAGPSNMFQSSMASPAPTVAPPPSAGPPSVISAIGAPPTAAPFAPPNTSASFVSPAQSPFGLAAPSPTAPFGSFTPATPATPPAPFAPSPLPGRNPAVASINSVDPFDGSHNPYATRRSKAPLPGKKLALIAGGATGGLLLLAVLIASATNGSSKPTTSSNKAVSSSVTGNLLPDIISRPDGTLDVNNLINTSKAVKPQSIQAKVNEQVNLSSGFSFLGRSVGTYQSSNPQPQAGRKFILIQVAVGNRSRNDNLSVSYLDFKLRDAENQLLDPHPLTQQLTGNSLAQPTEIKPGRQIDGRLVFEVDALQQSWLLVHSETYQKTTDNTTFTVEGRVSLEVKAGQ